MNIKRFREFLISSVLFYSLFWIAKILSGNNNDYNYHNDVSGTLLLLFFSLCCIVLVLRLNFKPYIVAISSVWWGFLAIIVELNTRSQSHNMLPFELLFDVVFFIYIYGLSFCLKLSYSWLRGNRNSDSTN